ncbi:MAG: hypothetical protein QJR13_03035 [Bacillota bacterium]|nr:hypothetical protein [Bacillota bacterium]
MREKALIPCPFCGYEYSPEEAVSSCRNCPFHRTWGRTCSLLRCPRCGYETPPPAGLAKFWQKWRKIEERKEQSR